MLRITSKGSFKNAEKYLEHMKEAVYDLDLRAYGKRGVEVLKKNTPKDTGLTADSWDFKIEKDRKGVTITWTNDNINQNVNVAILIQYGHGTRNGGYVKGIDYINPALAPVFEEILKDAWKEITKI